MNAVCTGDAVVQPGRLDAGQPVRHYRRVARNGGRREHKSFNYKPLESKTRFIALAEGMVIGLFSEEPGLGRCPGSGRVAVSHVSATHPNPAWRPKQPSLLAPLLLQPVRDRPAGRAGASPEPHLSTSVWVTEVLR